MRLFLLLKQNCPLIIQHLTIQVPEGLLINFHSGA